MGTFQKSIEGFMVKFLLKNNLLGSNNYQIAEVKPHKANISDTTIANVLHCLQDVSLYDYYATKKS